MCIQKYQCYTIRDNFGSGSAYVHIEEGIDDNFQQQNRIINGLYHQHSHEVTTPLLDNNNYLTRITAGLLEDMTGINTHYDSEYYTSTGIHLSISGKEPSIDIL